MSRNENGRRAYECIKFLTNATNQMGGFKEYLSQGVKEKEQLELAVKWLEKKVYKKKSIFISVNVLYCKRIDATY